MGFGGTKTWEYLELFYCKHISIGVPKSELVSPYLTILETLESDIRVPACCSGQFLHVETYLGKCGADKSCIHI